MVRILTQLCIQREDGCVLFNPGFGIFHMALLYVQDHQLHFEWKNRAGQTRQCILAENLIGPTLKEATLHNLSLFVASNVSELLHNLSLFDLRYTFTSNADDDPDLDGVLSFQKFPCVASLAIASLRVHKAYTEHVAKKI